MKLLHLLLLLISCSAIFVEAFSAFKPSRFYLPHTKLSSSATNDQSQPPSSPIAIKTMDKSKSLTQKDYKARLLSKSKITSTDVATLPKPGTTTPVSIKFLGEDKLAYLLWNYLFCKNDITMDGTTNYHQVCDHCIVYYLHTLLYQFKVCLNLLVILLLEVIDLCRIIIYYCSYSVIWRRGCRWLDKLHPQLIIITLFWTII